MILRGKMVLLVEDEPIIAFALEDMIRDEGADTRLATSLDMALDVLGRQAFDAAIIDVNLNGEYSYALAERLRERGVLFIFATGYGSVTHPSAFAGVPTVSKPYDWPSISTAFDAAKAEA